jgi:hypothetical protein
LYEGWYRAGLKFETFQPLALDEKALKAMKKIKKLAPKRQ